MQLLTPAHWQEYELIDSGEFQKLERFGKYYIIRPEPQAVWDKQLPEKEWEKWVHVSFIQSGSNSGTWKKHKEMPDRWYIHYTLPNQSKIQFKLALTAFKHVGVFPEQAVNWDFIFQSIKKSGIQTPRFLNLFAYTGGASLAAKAAGADVVHVDSIKQVVSWAKENMDRSNLANIRWVVEDALKFVKREVSRGNHYHGIILDPPAFGHGPNGEKWKLEDNINEMMKYVVDLLDSKQHFLILNAYSLGFSSLIIENLLSKNKKNLTIGELFLESKTQQKLPLGVFGRILKQ
ncbi:MAG: oxidoreductase [Bacteroidetes bacterium]|nr:oxidoreductase [Bacteroidota bacterium]MBV6461570.1 Ribosomal RNA large subunit methyltransferase K/L [Flavobacteriales bacterium]WKZ74051.1 MAG: class I SAM-dependent methyltransferase [Vicingaceae bacterium]MCL4817184.1 class I SAM-dependent methyltransferase [Flavobacteriales bacterium]NOG95861.1 oxidoreductase [Bacteroidota bacterium]